MLRLQALTSQAMEIQFTTRIFKEGHTYVAHALELDVSSCGGSKEKALNNLKEATCSWKKPRKWTRLSKSCKRRVTARPSRKLPALVSSVCSA
jgi:hypothetical protein